MVTADSATFQSDVVLRDGSTVRLRPVRPQDEELLLDFLRSLDERSLAFRFFTGAPNLKVTARLLADVDQRTRFGLLALRGPERRIVGHGFLAAIDEQRAEIAFAVSRDLQGHGLGTILLAQLAEWAAERSFSTLVADVLPENHSMISMFRDSGLPTEVSAEPDSVVVEMPAAADPESIARFQERDALAARAAVATFFEPGAVARLDRAPPDVAAQVRRLVAGGARALVVGGEPGDWRQADERELLEACRGAGVRLIGPGSLGILDNRRDPPLNLIDGTDPPPPPGPVGVVTQGAGASRELLDAARRRGVGVSTFASLGGRADVSANDLLEYWEEDPATEVALLEVESFSDPRRFARVARRVGARLPIVVIATHAAGGPPGHGLFDQVGAVRADGADEALELAVALAGRQRAGTKPPPTPAARATVAEARADEAAAILATALAGEGEELDRDACAALLDCYGIALDEERVAPAGSARLGVRVAEDPTFGPVLRCGPAGAPADRLPALVCPLDDDDAAMLLGHRSLAGAVPPDVAGRAALRHTLEATAALAAEHAEIAALELDPLLVSADGVAVAGGTAVRLRRPPRRRPWPRTWE